ncbi:MAG: MvaI/BcnI family restriction endonuclease [Ignavibacteria bacterium]
MDTITKEELIRKLNDLKNLGWVKNARQGNVGGVGNTLEDYLGIKENNLPIPNASEWELKSQRSNTASLTTLFHIEPSPRALKFVPNILLLNYGWLHKEAGYKYPASEISFRQTISGKDYSDRGFKVIIDRGNRKVLISFDSSKADPRHLAWLKSVESRTGLEQLNPQPYWGFDDLFHKAGTKLLNCFYVQADSKKENGIEYFSYNKILQLQQFSIDKFLIAMENNNILVDFDARTGHNHGTKFRMRQNCLPDLYATKIVI